MDEFDATIRTQQSLALENPTVVTSDEIKYTNQMLRLIKSRSFFIFSKKNEAYRNIDKTSAEKVDDYTIAAVAHLTENLHKSHLMHSEYLWNFLGRSQIGKELALWSETTSTEPSKQTELSKNVYNVIETALAVDKLSKKENKMYINYTKSCSSWKNLNDMNNMIKTIPDEEDEEMELDPQDSKKIHLVHQKELNRLKKLNNIMQKLISAFPINYLEDEDTRGILQRTAYVNHICEQYDSECQKKKITF